MEVKRVAVVAACCMFILLFSGQQQQVSAMSKICRCYHECLPNCGLRNSNSFCKVFCGGCCVINIPHNCTSTDVAATAGITGDDCREICLTSFCGESATSHCQTMQMQMLQLVSMTATITGADMASSPRSWFYRELESCDEISVCCDL